MRKALACAGSRSSEQRLHSSERPRRTSRKYGKSTSTLPNYKRRQWADAKTKRRQPMRLALYARDIGPFQDLQLVAAAANAAGHDITIIGNEPLGDRDILDPAP